MTIKTNNEADLAGYTKEYVATAIWCELNILVKPDTDFDTRFKAWDLDEEEFVYINGWNWRFEEVSTNA